MTESATDKSAVKRYLVPLVLTVWFCGCAFLLGSLAVTHVVALPGPEDGSLQALLNSLRELRVQERGELVVHVLADDCSCTESLFNTLEKNGPDPDADEVMLFVGDNADKARRAVNAGYRFVSISQDQLADMGLESAPVLAIFNESNEVGYLGGYYDHPAATNPLDRKLRLALAEGEPVAPLPIYGCAVSERLQQAFDPYGIIYES